MLYQYHKKDHYAISYDSDKQLIEYNTLVNGKLYPDQEASYIENLIGTSVFEFFFHYWGGKYRDELLEKFDGVDSGTLRFVESAQSPLMYRCTLMIDIPEKIHKYHGNEEIRAGSMSNTLKSQNKKSWYTYHVIKKGRQHRPVRSVDGKGVIRLYSSALTAAAINDLSRATIYKYIHGTIGDPTGRIWEYVPDDEMGEI